MTVECTAIAAIILIMAYMIFRTGRRGQAVAVCPLAIVPTVHLLGAGVAPVVGKLWEDLPLPVFRISLDVLGLVVACILYGLLAGNMMTARGRKFYMVLCAGFSAILTIVLIQSTLV